MATWVHLPVVGQVRGTSPISRYVLISEGASLGYDLLFRGQGNQIAKTASLPLDLAALTCDSSVMVLKRFKRGSCSWMSQELCVRKLIWRGLWKELEGSKTRKNSGIFTAEGKMKGIERELLERAEAYSKAHIIYLFICKMCITPFPCQNKCPKWLIRAD